MKIKIKKKACILLYAGFFYTKNYMNLTEEELNKVKDLQLRNTQITYELGEVSLTVMEAKILLESRQQDQDNLYTQYVKIFNEGDELFKILKDKYGEGSINLDTGEVINLK